MIDATTATLHTLELRGNPQRFNSGTMRRYRFTNGAVLVCCASPTKSVKIIPPSCFFIAVPCDRDVAALALQWGRHNRRRGAEARATIAKATGA